MFVRPVHGVLVTLALGLQLAACGGGGDGGGGNDPPPNRAPAANAGTDQTVFKAATVTLEGGASADPDGSTLTYRWTQTAGTAITLSSSTGSRPTFSAPNVSGVLTFSLVVNDGRIGSPADSVSVTVQNRAPVANAGADADIEAGTLFTLNGLASTDPDQDAITHEWIQLAGPAVALAAVGPGRMRFVSPPADARLEFGLTAHDGESASAQDVVIINVTKQSANLPPVVYAPANPIESPKRGQVSLDIYAFDPEGHSMTVSWRQLTGPTVTLTGADTFGPAFTAPETPTTFSFEVTVADELQAASTQVVEVVVRNFAPDLQALSLTPFEPKTNDDLTVEPEVFDQDGDPVTFTFVWSRNGVAVPGVTGAVYPASLTTRDDEIVVTVTASDGPESESLFASTIILDSLPTLVATPPTQVNYGADVAFQVTAGPDPDGDVPGPFTVRLGPAGFAVDSAGAVDWRAQLPMFEENIDVAWSVGLRDFPDAVLSGVIRVTDTGRQQPLVRSGSTHPQNPEQLVVADLDGDGIQQILVSDGRTIGTLAMSGADFVQDWGYPFNLSGVENGISAIAVGEINGDSHAEIFASSEGRIRQIDGATRRESHEFFAEEVRQCLALRVADLEGDGPRELICLGSASTSPWDGASVIYILNAADLSLKAKIDQTGLGRGLAIGNVDADAPLELVTGAGYVFDGGTRLNEWAYGPGFGDNVDLGDLNGDGINEIVSSGYTVPRAFSAVLRSPIAEINLANNYGLTALRVASVDGDNRAEVILGDAQWGNVSIYRYDSAAQSFSLAAQVNSQEHGVSAIQVGNVDADPAIEVIWDAGYTSSGADVFVVGEFASPSTLAVQWSSATVGEFDGPFVGGALARIAPSTSRLMFVSPTTESGYGGARLFALDLSGGTSPSPQISNNFYATTSLDVADFDGDSIDEIFLSSSTFYDPYFQAYDFQGGTAEWTSSTGYAMARAMRHGDFSGDGRPDFAVFGDDRRVTIFNPAQSTILWQSTQLGGGSAIDMVIGDINGDGLLEVVALTESFLYIYGRGSAADPFLELRNVSVPNGSHLLLADADGNGTPEIYVAVSFYTGNTALQVYDPMLQLVRSLYIDARITNLELEPGAQARKNLLIATDYTNSYSWYTYASEIWAIDPITGAGVWRSPRMQGTVSRHSLYAPDVDANGQYELSFGTSVGAFLTR